MERTRRRPEAEEAQPTVSGPERSVVPAPTIVPRIVGGEVAQLRREYEQLERMIHSEVIDHSERVAAGTDAAARDVAGFGLGVLGLGQLLDRLRITEIPILGERFVDEVSRIRGLINEAERLENEGRVQEAEQLLRQAREQLRAVGDVFGIELGILTGRMASGSLTAESAAQLNDIFDGLEAVIPDAGTTRTERYRHMLHLGRMLIRAAGLESSGVEEWQAMWERTAGQIIMRGTQARMGKEYNRQDEEADLNSFKAIKMGIVQLESNMGTALQDLVQIEEAINTILSEQQDADSIRRFRELQRDINNAIERAREGHEISPEEAQILIARYRTLADADRTLREQDERAGMLIDAARELRGTAGTVRDGTPEWFGEQALAALREGNIQIASLAVALGSLERGTGSLNRIPSYQRLHDIIRNRGVVTTGMLAEFSAQAEAACASAVG
jgi:hypothetical protein